MGRPGYEKYIKDSEQFLEKLFDADNAEIMDADWESLVITSDQLGDRVGNSFVINMPKSSKYSGYYFFHPAKLVRPKSYYYTFSFTNEFSFNLKKNGSGKWNKYEVIATTTLNAEQMKTQFEKQQKIDK